METTSTAARSNNTPNNYNATATSNATVQVAAHALLQSINKVPKTATTTEFLSTAIDDTFDPRNQALYQSIGLVNDDDDTSDGAMVVCYIQFVFGNDWIAAISFYGCLVLWIWQSIGSMGNQFWKQGNFELVV